MPGLEEKLEKFQMDTQIYCLRDKAEDILATFKLSHEDSENFDLIKVIFNKYFMDGIILIYDRSEPN